MVCDFSADGYRLPTEPEWEFAARGGNKSKNFTYSGSNTLDDVGWYEKNTTDSQEVATKQANELGLYDMSGNVHEWCWDWYVTYEGGDQINPEGAATGTRKVLKGGGWQNSESFCTNTYCAGLKPFEASVFIGFRVCRSVGSRGNDE